MSQPSPTFARPPVVEVVLGLQFASISGLTSGHLGWFWKVFLGEEWVKAADAPPIPDQFETFAEPSPRGAKQLHIQLERVLTPRLQVGNGPRDRQIQVQPSRFHYNWLKKDAAYPSYSRVLQEFEHHWDTFARFVEEARLGPLLVNQWELTYVDLIPQGELWQSPAEWHEVLPGLLAPERKVEGLVPEGVGGEWHHEIIPRRGRLHTSIQKGRFAGSDEAALLVKTTARGPVGKDGVPSWKEGLNLGHEMALAQFLRVTSDKAQQHWGIKA